MANFKDIYRKYTVLGQCFYNLENHEIKADFKGNRGVIESYNTPVQISDFIEMIGDFMKKYSVDLYRDEAIWIGFENKEEKTIVSLNYDNK